MMMPSTMILTLCISMVLTRNRGLSLDSGSRYERAEHKTHNSNHKSQSISLVLALILYLHDPKQKGQSENELHE